MCGIGMACWFTQPPCNRVTAHTFRCLATPSRQTPYEPFPRNRTSSNDTWMLIISTGSKYNQALIISHPPKDLPSPPGGQRLVSTLFFFSFFFGVCQNLKGMPLPTIPCELRFNVYSIRLPLLDYASVYLWKCWRWTRAARHVCIGYGTRVCACSLQLGPNRTLLILQPECACMCVASFSIHSYRSPPKCCPGAEPNKTPFACKYHQSGPLSPQPVAQPLINTCIFSGWNNRDVRCQHYTMFFQF